MIDMFVGNRMGVGSGVVNDSSLQFGVECVISKGFEFLFQLDRGPEES